MEERALELGFRPMEAGDAEYLVVPGYSVREPEILSSAPLPQLSALSILPEYNESLLDWVDEKISSSSRGITMRQQYARRTQVLTVVMGLVALAIIVQMTRIQNSVEAATFRQQASNYAYELRTFYPDRGEIYDRNGHLLAGNKTVFEIGVDLNNMKDPEAIAAAVSVKLGIDYAQVLRCPSKPAGRFILRGDRGLY